MNILLDELKREIRRLKEVAPSCSDDGINTLMDIHDDLLRLVKKIETSLRSTVRKANALEDPGDRGAAIRE